jgi:glycosyltransferase involved in cell wall biosynthesis
MTISRSIKVTRSTNNDRCIIEIIGNKLCILVTKKSENPDDTLTLKALNKTLAIEWLVNKNDLIKEFLSDFNLLKNGTFGDTNGKSLSGWEVDFKKPAIAHVDLAQEWHLKEGHTAFLFAPKGAERPSFLAEHKIPVIDDGSVDYYFSGYFATHRASGIVTVGFYDKADNKLGEENIPIPFDPECGGGQSLLSYTQIESVFIPVKETQYMRFKIKLGKQEDFVDPHACLFFTELCLGLYDELGDNSFVPFSNGIDKLTHYLLKDKWSRMGMVKLPALEKATILDALFEDRVFKINLSSELSTIRLMEKEEEQPSHSLNVIEASPRDISSQTSAGYWQFKKMADIYPFYGQLKETEDVSTHILDKKVVCIIAELSLVQCTKYRVSQIKQIYEDNGYKVQVTGWNDFWRSMEIIQQSAIAIFYRVPMSDEFKAYLMEIERLKLKSYYDIDDPIFNIELIESNKNIIYLEDSVVSNLIEDSYKYRQAMMNMRHFIVSTSGMKKVIMSQFGVKKTRVVVRRNAVDENTLRLSKNSIKNNGESEGVIRIIYATPSLAHSADFTACSRAIVKILEKYRARVKLVLMGDVELPLLLKKFKKNIIHEKSGSYEKFMQILGGCDINIVPLLDDEFNATKSNIKFLDAAILKVPSICSPVGDYDFLQDGKECFLANNKQQWIEKLSILIEDKKTRTKMGKDAYMLSQQKYSLKGIGSKFIKEAGKTL